MCRIIIFLLTISLSLAAIELNEAKKAAAQPSVSGSKRTGGARDSSAKRSSKTMLRGIRWWNLGVYDKEGALAPNNKPTPPLEDAGRTRQILQQLTKKQRRMVLDNPGTLNAVVRAAGVALYECRAQMSRRRWDCSVNERVAASSRSIYGKILRKGSRETAFVYALFSAALTNEIARMCAEGSIHGCKCGVRTYKEQLPKIVLEQMKQTNGLSQQTPSMPVPNGIPNPAAVGESEFKWHGCSEDARFGNKFARMFTNTMGTGGDLRSVVNQHNNEAGRIHAVGGMVQTCKCHGMSGSCQFRTCWMKMKPFAETGALIKEAFDSAHKVTQANIGNGQRPQPRSRTRSARIEFHPSHPYQKPPGRRDLVYFESSPDFCRADASFGYAGSAGRRCVKNSKATDGCDLLCCGRGFTSKVVTVRKRCQCKFKWCCTVECKTCSEQVEVSTCK